MNELNPDFLRGFLFSVYSHILFPLIRWIVLFGIYEILLIKFYVILTTLIDKS